MLRDTAHIAESDADFVNRHRPGDSPVEPLFTIADAEATMPLFRPVPYHKRTTVAETLEMESYDAGHILGSSSIMLSGEGIRLVYSGDVGRPGLPIIRDPEQLPPADYLIMESTYGSRKHPPTGESVASLEEVFKRTIGRGGRLIIPAFAVGRVQQIVLLFHQLVNEGRIQDVPFFVDSPLAVDVTKTFRAHPECFDEETAKYLAEAQDPFGFKRLIYIRDAQESKKLNDLRGPFVVISPSGMCEAGRVLHHLRHNIGDPKNTVLITGYQAENTLGRRLKEGARSVRIFGIPTEVRAEIRSLDELSGHADSGELIDWMKPITPTLKKVFLVHGEPQESRPLAQSIYSTYGIEAVPVEPGQIYDLR
jgi:metallo-beta-lactamase family protein